MKTLDNSKGMETKGSDDIYLVILSAKVVNLIVNQSWVKNRLDNEYNSVLLKSNKFMMRFIDM